MQSLCKYRLKQVLIIRNVFRMSDTKINGECTMNGTERKSPFLIGVAGGTASGKVQTFGNVLF